MSAITRRSALGTFALMGAAAVGGGIGLLRPVHRKVALPPAPPPAALVTAANDSRRLAAAYASALPRDPANTGLLTSLRSDVAAHEAALLALLEKYPGWRYEQSLPAGPASMPSGSGTPYPSPPSGPAIQPGGDALRAALSQVSAAAARACASWPATEPNAAEAVGLLGSISATLATHVQALS